MITKAPCLECYQCGYFMAFVPFLDFRMSGFCTDKCRKSWLKEMSSAYKKGGV